MLSDYTIDDQSVGLALPVENGFLVKLSMTTSPNPSYQQPSFDEGRQIWTAGRFVLRGSGDFRDLVCIDAGSGGGWASHGSQKHLVLVDASLGYRGQLVVVAVQKGSTWLATVSDIPYVPVKPPWPLMGSPAERKPISVRAEAFEKALRPRQLNDTRRSAANRGVDPDALRLARATRRAAEAQNAADEARIAAERAVAEREALERARHSAEPVP